MVLAPRPSRRLRESILYRPFQQVQSTIDGAVMDACFARPAEECLGSAIKGYKAVVRFIIGLNLSVGPLAVLRGVWSVVVDAVEEKTRLIEVLVIRNEVGNIKPAVAYRYAPPSISLIARIVRLKASVLHAMPNLIERVLRESVLPVLRFMALATAGRGLAISKSTARNNFLRTAVADAQPLHVAAPLLGMKVNNRKATEPLASEVNVSFFHSPNEQYSKVKVNG